MNKSLLAFACAGLVLLAAPAAAQNIKPGLWEIQNKMGGSGDMGNKMAAAQAEMQKQLAAMRRNSASRWKK